MKEFEVELSNGIKISAKLEYGELIYGVTAIAIGKNNNYKVRIKDLKKQFMK